MLKTTTITCPYCNRAFEMTDAIQHQIDAEIEHAKEQQLQALRQELDRKAQIQTQEAVKEALEDARQDMERQLEKARREAARNLDKARQETEDEVEKATQEAERLRREAEQSRKTASQLRHEQEELMNQLTQALNEKEDAQRAARKQLLEKEREIKEEAARKAAEDYNTKLREQEQTIQMLREQLTAAKQVAEQGSQQLQGEILELDIERDLKAAFPTDTITEVRKGERGADIRQIINERTYTDCGLVLWECKNAKNFQASWQTKLREELVKEKARAGVIVFQPTGGEGDDFKRLDENIWLIKPRYAVMLASMLREIFIRVTIANRNAQGKDIKMEMMYDYLTGDEFSARIRTIIESYNEMAAQLDLEKKQTEKRWAAQEKILKKSIQTLYGMSGDLQGISGREIITLPEEPLTLE